MTTADEQLTVKALGLSTKAEDPGDLYTAPIAGGKATPPANGRREGSSASAELAALAFATGAPDDEPEYVLVYPDGSTYAIVPSDPDASLAALASKEVK